MAEQHFEDTTYISHIRSNGSLACPECGSHKLWKDGLRYIRGKSQATQRWLCRECGFRFSENCLRETNLKPSECSEGVQNVDRQVLNCRSALPSSRQVCELLTEGSKNLATVDTTQEQQNKGAGATKADPATIEGKFVNFRWELKKQGLKDGTIECYQHYLDQLLKHGANLLDPESVKETIAKSQWSENTKALVIASYTRFLKFNKGTWEPPKCESIRKLPFIPLESELDALISGASRKLTAFLQLLKETGMRCGEALRLKWTDIDFKNGAITLNQPEKHGSPRMFKISAALTSMLNMLPKPNDFIFGGRNTKGYGRTFQHYRKKTAFKLQNPRLKQISFHTFRHWKATMEYHKTKDILHVMQMLGHRDIKTTLIYTQLIQFESDEYYSAVAKTIEEAKGLVETGFEYVCDIEDVKLFRKRK